VVKLALIVVVTALAAAGASLVDPIPQDPRFHEFADQRTFLGVPHFGNVVSNLAFLAVAAAWTPIRHAIAAIERRVSLAFTAVFTGLALVSVGSAYYHFNPVNETLFWDRLPMAITFTPLLAAVVADRVDPRMGLGLLPAFVLLGAASVIYWRVTGDLRPYYFVQGYCLVVLTLVCALWRGRLTDGRYVAAAIGCYVAAVVLELSDGVVFALLRETVSGHTLKHFVAATAGLVILLMLRAGADRSAGSRVSPNR
jgi:hypothetical protein